MKNTLDTSWIAGKYPEVDAEINTKLPFVSIGVWFFQGDEAEKVIKEIHAIWVKRNCTVEDAINRFQTNYFLGE